MTWPPPRPGIPLSLKAPSFTDARFTMEAWCHEQRAMRYSYISITYLIYVQIFLRIKKGRWNWRNLKMLIRKGKESSPVDSTVWESVSIFVCILWKLKQETPRLSQTGWNGFCPRSLESMWKYGMAGGHHCGQLWSGHPAGCCDQGQGPSGPGFDVRTQRCLCTEVDLLIIIG